MVAFQDTGRYWGKANGGNGRLLACGLALENGNVRAKHVVGSRDITALQLAVPNDVLVKPGFEIIVSRKHEGFLKSTSLFSTRVVSFGVFGVLILYGGNQRDLDSAGAATSE
jgi:hypothetical protein